jgi:Txe/YoeB family toxin of Txe-Axe toxin-antitoxin module
MFENRKIRVTLSEEADVVFQEFSKIAKEEKDKGINSSFHQTLLRSIERAIDLLKENPFYGNQIPRKKMPKKYSKKYDADNVWRIELSDRWRMIYTITGNKLEIISFIMDIFSHKDYDKVFGYK